MVSYTITIIHIYVAKDHLCLITNSADHDEMLLPVAFYLSIHCLSNTYVQVSSIQWLNPNNPSVLFVGLGKQCKTRSDAPKRSLLFAYRSFL